MLVAKFPAQRRFLILQRLQLRAERIPHQKPQAQRRDGHEAQAYGPGPDGERPAAGIARVEVAQFVEQLHAPPPACPARLGLAAAAACSSSAVVLVSSALSLKFSPALSFLAVLSITSRSALRIHCEASIAR